jgi:hypothetical protein
MSDRFNTTTARKEFYAYEGVSFQRLFFVKSTSEQLLMLPLLDHRDNRLSRNDKIEHSCIMVLNTAHGIDWDYLRTGPQT